jgi:tRNA (guanine37-N1)-methyltransferase
VRLRDELICRLEPWELKLIPASYDVVGDIAIIRVPESLEHRSGIVARAIMRIDKHVKTVLRQASPVSGNFRLREFEFVAGERKTETVHKEFGCLFKVDLRQSYFSPRLSHERMRIARQVEPFEFVVNMFAGVGCFSIFIAKHSRAVKVYSIDINAAAMYYHRENIRLNKVEGTVEPVLGDAKEIIEERLEGIADRVLMPLPERAYEYLECARSALKPRGGSIHYYGFEHADKGEDPIERMKKKVSQKLSHICSRFEIPSARIVRTTGPRWYQIVLDIRIS